RFEQDALPGEAQPERDVERHEEHVGAREEPKRFRPAPDDTEAARGAEQHEGPQRAVAVREPEQRREIQEAARSGKVTANGREPDADGHQALLADERRDLSEERAVGDDPDDAHEPREHAPDELGRHWALHDLAGLYAKSKAPRRA